MSPQRSFARIFRGMLARCPNRPAQVSALWHGFHSSTQHAVVKPFLLADIGEGIRECEVIQWFVQPGARVGQFDPLCEVQSDKASVEITSRFDGVIKKLHYDAGDMAAVGKPLVDIDVQDEIDVENEPTVTSSTGSKERERDGGNGTSATAGENCGQREASSPLSSGPDHPSTDYAKLATPAVRHLTKELKVDIADVFGTGKDGRVLKEDVHRFVQERSSDESSNSGIAHQFASTAAEEDALKLGTDLASERTPQQERVLPLTPIQQQMFKTMTRSLSIPHFVYADEYNLDALTKVRARLNKHLLSDFSRISKNAPPPPPPHLTALPFILKALSLTLHDFPLLNARLDTSSVPSKPQLVLRPQHNIGIAVATPHGLLVPVVHAVDTLSILAIATELQRLQALALAGALAPAHLAGGTITVSNIGAVGGTYVAPVIVPEQVAILGVGRARTVPAFEEEDDAGGDGAAGSKVVKRVVAHFSWSADHRVVDGALLARAAERVRTLLEQPEFMLAWLR